MITVTAATGQLGRLVMKALLARAPAECLTAAVRDPDKAADLAATGVRVVRADYDDAESLAAAFEGTERLLMISGDAFGRRVEQTARVAAAARGAGVGFIAYTSLLRAAENPMMLAQEHKAAEGLIAGTGAPHALLRNGWYAENYAAAIGVGAAHGRIGGAAGDGRIAAAARADYAEAAAVVLTEGAAGTFELGGDAPFTLAELSAEVARQVGRPVVYENLTPERYEAELAAHGLPAPFAAALADTDRWAAEGWLDTGSGVLSKLIGRPTTPLAETVRAVLAAAPQSQTAQSQTA